MSDVRKSFQYIIGMSKKVYTVLPTAIKDKVAIISKEKDVFQLGIPDDITMDKIITFSFENDIPGATHLLKGKYSASTDCNNIAIEYQAMEYDDPNWENKR